MDGTAGDASCTSWGYAGTPTQPLRDERHVRDLMDQMMHALQQQDGSDKLVKVVKTAGGDDAC